MKYMGSKRRIAKYILPIILKNRKPGQLYVEPFLGGFNSFKLVENPRLGSDSNKYVIALCKAMQDGWNPPETLTEEEYKNIRLDKFNYSDHLVGYVGFCLSYGGKWFGGYCRDGLGKRNYIDEARRLYEKEKPLIYGSNIICSNYLHLNIPNDSIVYCDPPYKDSTKYSSKFDHNEFWDWARKTSEQNQVFISEYEAPEDFECIWSMEIKSSLTRNTGSKVGVEKLFKRRKVND